METYRKNRAGIKPSLDYNDVPFNIRTDDVSKFLYEKRFAVLSKVISSKTGEKYNFPATVFTLSLSKKYFPIMLVIPEDAIVKPERSVDVAPIFDVEMYGDRVPPLIQPYYDVLRAYMYSNDERKAFKHSEYPWEDERLHISRRVRTMFHRMMRPSLMKFHDHDKAFIVALDPIKVFHDMLSNDDSDKDNVDMMAYICQTGKTISDYKSYNRKIHQNNQNDERFRVNIQNCKKIKGSLYSYRVQRLRVGKNSRNKMDKKHYINEIVNAFNHASNIGGGRPKFNGHRKWR